MVCVPRQGFWSFTGAKHNLCCVPVSTVDTRYKSEHAAQKAPAASGHILHVKAIVLKWGARGFLGIRELSPGSTKNFGRFRYIRYLALFQDGRARLLLEQIPGTSGIFGLWLLLHCLGVRFILLHSQQNTHNPMHTSPQYLLRKEISCCKVQYSLSCYMSSIGFPYSAKRLHLAVHSTLPPARSCERSQSVNAGAQIARVSVRKGTSTHAVTPGRYNSRC